MSVARGGDTAAAARLRRGMQIGGAVAAAAGLDTAVRGGRSFPPWRTAEPMIESELRFYGVFYAAYGVSLLRAARAPERDSPAVRVAAGMLFAAGLARAGGWLRTGRPHPLQQALLAVELTLPALAALESARQRSGD